MSKYLAQARTALRKVENRESLDESDVPITVIALKRIVQEGRTPFQRFRDHFIIGTEKFKVYDGLDYLRAIIMHKVSATWYSDSRMAELTIFEVYTASQPEPPQAYNYDPEEATPDEYALYSLGFVPNSDIGPSCNISDQEILAPIAIELLQRYVAELSTLDSKAAVEKKQELENWLREETPSAKFIEQGNLKGVVGAYHKAHRYHGQLRTFPGPSQAIADKVRKAVNYALDALRENPLTVDIAKHLKRYCRIGQICEYTGDLKWRF